MDLHRSLLPQDYKSLYILSEVKISYRKNLTVLNYSYLNFGNDASFNFKVQYSLHTFSQQSKFVCQTLPNLNFTQKTQMYLNFLTILICGGQRSLYPRRVIALI